MLHVEDPTLVKMAVSTVKHKHKGKLLWEGSHSAFRDLFQVLVKDLGFQPGSYLPYSLRRGGATWFYQTTLSLEATVVRGRWSCAKIARGYIDSGTLQLARLIWTAKQAKLVQKWRIKGARLRLRQMQKDLVLTERVCVCVFFNGWVLTPFDLVESGMTEAFFRAYGFLL